MSYVVDIALITYKVFYSTSYSEMINNLHSEVEYLVFGLCLCLGRGGRMTLQDQ